MKNIKLVSNEKGWFEITTHPHLLRNGGFAPVWTYILLSDKDAVEVENIISESDNSSSVSFQFVDELKNVIQSVIVSEIPFEIIVSTTKANNRGQCYISGKKEYLSKLIQNHKFDDNYVEDLGEYTNGSIKKISLNEIKNHIPIEAY